jgi:hypothetical protein
VHAHGTGVFVWGRVRPGRGRRTAQLQVLRQGRWEDAGRPVTTNAAGFFTARRKLAAPYRFLAPGIGISRTASPI